MNRILSSRHLWLAAVLLAFALGIFARTASHIRLGGHVYPMASFTGTGFDEGLYRTYTGQLLSTGLSGYPQMVERYIEFQKTLKGSIAPPLRFLYIGVSALWCSISGAAPLHGLRQVASFFSVLMLGVSFAFMYRMAGRGAALAVLALMACAPTQIHMSQHALLDGFFTFWATLALWMLWENLRHPSRPWLLAAYGLTLALLVLTKENAAFVYLGLLAILAANRWLRFGTVNRPLLLATVLGPAAGVLGLIALAGGLETLFTSYILSVSKNYTLEYAIKTGDGPWYRYILDSMIVSPIVVLLAVGAIFQLTREERPQLFVLVFVAASYCLMCNVRYGMNLRYANIWDAPLRLLAFTQLGFLAGRFGGKRREIVLAVAIVVLCGLELRQYWIFAIQFHGLYELVTETLLRAVKILK